MGADIGASVAPAAGVFVAAKMGAPLTMETGGSVGADGLVKIRSWVPHELISRYMLPTVPAVTLPKSAIVVGVQRIVSLPMHQHRPGPSPVTEMSTSRLEF